MRAEWSYVVGGGEYIALERQWPHWDTLAWTSSTSEVGRMGNASELRTSFVRRALCSRWPPSSRTRHRRSSDASIGAAGWRSTRAEPALATCFRNRWKGTRLSSWMFRDRLLSLVVLCKFIGQISFKSISHQARKTSVPFIGPVLYMCQRVMSWQWEEREEEKKKERQGQKEKG